tara:strand:- start:971 stop:2410 length:1440 start_codon:yes stop_codon:yes gene_type:complete
MIIFVLIIGFFLLGVGVWLYEEYKVYKVPKQTLCEKCNKPIRTLSTTISSDGKKIFHYVCDYCEKLNLENKRKDLLSRVVNDKFEFDNQGLRDAVDSWLKNSVDAEKKYGHINNWNTSKVTNMSKLFHLKVNPDKPLLHTSFNEPIGDWDVSEVTDMTALFGGLKNFNQDLSKWDVSNVRDMTAMFYKATSFNQDIGSWNVGNVRNMRNMFQNASSFNCGGKPYDKNRRVNINLNEKFERMMDQYLYGYDESNDLEPISNKNQISEWNVQNVKNMTAMFKNASSFVGRQIVSWQIQEDCITNNIFENIENFGINVDDIKYKVDPNTIKLPKGKKENSNDDSQIIKLKYLKNNGADDLNHNPLTGKKVDFFIAKPFDLNAIVEIGAEIFHINYILIEQSLEHDLDYIYIGLCDEKFNIKKWVDPNKSKAEFINKIYLLGEILIDEDLCEACSVRYIDDFNSHILDDSYDYQKLLEVRDNW